MILNARIGQHGAAIDVDFDFARQIAEIPGANAVALELFGALAAHRGGRRLSELSPQCFDVAADRKLVASQINDPIIHAQMIRCDGPVVAGNHQAMVFFDVRG